MDGQQNFSDMEYANRKWKTKREEFLEAMNEVISWDEQAGIILPDCTHGYQVRTLYAGSGRKAAESCSGRIDSPSYNNFSIIPSYDETSPIVKPLSMHSLNFIPNVVSLINAAPTPFPEETAASA